MTTSFWDHPIETIEKALHIRKQIEALQESLRELYGDGRQPLSVEKSTPSKDARMGKRSAATRAKMKAAQQARWAKKKPTPVAVNTVKGPKSKRVVSATSRKKMAAAAKVRWAKKKMDASVNMPNKMVW